MDEEIKHHKCPYGHRLGDDHDQHDDCDDCSDAFYQACGGAFVSPADREPREPLERPASCMAKRWTVRIYDGETLRELLLQHAPVIVRVDNEASMPCFRLTKYDACA